MFVVIYQFTIHAGKESEFRKSWLKLTQGIYVTHGSLGSRLHVTADPLVYISYAQWPSKEVWENADGDLSDEYQKARQNMRACIQSFEIIYKLDVLDDYFSDKIFKTQFTKISQA